MSSGQKLHQLIMFFIFSFFFQANHVSYNWNTVAFFAVCIVAAVFVFVYIIGQVDIISIIVGIAVVVGGVVIIVIVIDRSAGRTSAHKPADKKQWRETTTSCSSVWH